MTLKFGIFDFKNSKENSRHTLFFFGVLLFLGLWTAFAGDRPLAVHGLVPEPDALVHFTYGSFLSADQDLEGAEKEFQEALKLDPEATYIALKLAEVLIEKKELEKAFQMLLPLSATQGSYGAQASLLMGGICLLQKNKMNAVSFFNQALSQDPRNKRAYTTLSDLYEQEGLLTEAISVNEKADQIFENTPEFKIKLGTQYFLNHDAEKALTAYESAKEMLPNDPGVLLGLGLCLDQLKHWEESRSCLEKYLLLNPLNFAVYKKLLHVKAELAEWDSAFQLCDQWISMNPESEEGYVQYAVLALKSKSLESAVPLLEQAEDKFPQSGDIAFWLGRLYYEKKDGVRARSCYKKALSKSLKKSEILYHYAVLFHDEKKNQDALDQLQKAVEEDSQNANALNFMGYLLIEMNHPVNEAIVFIEKALRLNPENSAFLDSMGWALYKKGSFREALMYQEKAAALSKDEEILKHLAEIRKALGGQKND